jgi:putative restriction endonuclease
MLAMALRYAERRKGVDSERIERVERLIEGLGEAGYRVGAGYDPSAQPLLLTVRDGGTTELRVFSWRITHGGAQRDANEFRVQTTRPGNQPLLKTDRQTLLLGYDEGRDIFAAWSAQLHPNPGSSSSLQVSRELLEVAAQEGLASRARDTSAGTEMVVAFRPAGIGAYLEMMPHLPGPQASDMEVHAAARAASDQEVPVDELPSDAVRREAIREIRTRSRDQRFRFRVLSAYEHRCAFCGIDAGLAQAAHIEGVAEGGPDLITNGVGACPTHHIAFDLGLLTIADDLAIIVNEPRLRARGAGDEDVEAFRIGLLDHLAVPASEDLRPDPERLAGHHKQWEL